MPRVFRLVLILVLTACVGVAPPARAEYDQDAEIQRLINQAREDIDKTSQAIEELKAKRELLRSSFLDLNQSGAEIGELLRKVRMVDARNKAMMIVKGGLPFTAVNVPGKAAEIATQIAVDVGSQFLQQKYPRLFDTSVRAVLPKVGESAVAEVKKLNWVMSLSDQEMAGKIRADNPQVAQDESAWRRFVTGGGVTDDLMALKRAEYIIEAGTKAEVALEQLKRALAERQRAILDAIAELEKEVERRKEDIRSWERNREVAQAYQLLSSLPRAESVQVNPEAIRSFDAASQLLDNAWNQLSTNKLDCGSFQNMLWAASYGAEQAWFRQSRDIWNGCNSDHQCYSQRVAPVWNAYLRVVERRDRIQQNVNDTNEQQAQPFIRRLAELSGRTIATQKWPNQPDTLRVGDTSGDGLANALFDFLPVAPEAMVEDWMPIHVGGLSSDAFRFPEYSMLSAAERGLEHTKRMRELIEQTQKTGEKSASDASAAASDASQLAKDLEPKVHFWGCVSNGGVSTETLGWLKTFEPAYSAQYAINRDLANRWSKAARDQEQKWQQVASALQAERPLMEFWGKASLLMAELSQVTRDEYRPGSTLVDVVRNAGITSAMIRALQEAMPQLGNEEYAEKFLMRMVPGEAEYDPTLLKILNAGELERLREQLKKMAAHDNEGFAKYTSLYRTVTRMEKELAEKTRALSNRLVDIAGEGMAIGAPTVITGSGLPPPEDLLDPSDWAFQLLDIYSKLALTFHELTDHLAPWAIVPGRKLKALADKLEKESPSLMAADESDFISRINVYNRDSTLLLHEATRGGKLGPKSLASRAYARVVNLVNEISTRYFSGKRIAKLGQELTRAARDIDAFLASPDGGGGPAQAGVWVGVVDSLLAPGGEADQLRADSGIASLWSQLASQRGKLANYQSRGGDAAVRKLYQDFAEAYQTKALGRLTRFLANDWKAADGADLTDLEDILANSFRVFDRIQFSITNLSIQPINAGRFQASYTVTIIGTIHAMNMKHQESSNVEDTVVMTPEGARIQSTRGGRLWLQ
jgi:hypothetical protein